MVDGETNYIEIAVTGELKRPEKKYKSVSLLEIGAIRIPWPEDLTAEQALMEWKTNG